MRRRRRRRLELRAPRGEAGPVASRCRRTAGEAPSRRAASASEYGSSGSSAPCIKLDARATALRSSVLAAACSNAWTSTQTDSASRATPRSSVAMSMLGDATQIVQRAMQVVRARFEILFRPDPIDQLLAMQHASRRERERHEHLDRPPLRPRRSGHQLAVHLDGKPAEQKHARQYFWSRHGRPSVLKSVTPGSPGPSCYEQNCTHPGYTLVVPTPS